MKLNIQKPQSLNLPVKLLHLLNTETVKQGTSMASVNAVTFNFRDDDYSADTGGYHPVEIRIEKVDRTQNDEQWQFIYMTDFSYQGAPFPELVKEIDICFVSKRVHSLYGGYLNHSQGQQLLTVFISNFIEYHSMGAYHVTIICD